MFEFGYDPVLLWMPIQEEDYGQERFLETSHVIRSATETCSQCLSLLKQEYLGGKDISNKTASELGKLYADSIIGFGVSQIANLMARHSAQPVYYYEFGYIGSNSHYVDPTTKKPTGNEPHIDHIISIITFNTNTRTM
ncbi:unnamed protein product [Arctia plantaginis]|uniref:Carboxylesterase type B domain-containing protein n=1 Tax=Arctia plantaginis TaxID=874455 RepID=A0A8S1BU43_ARCPL|nr:unnamed protein product [Arctia plantaginis]